MRLGEWHTHSRPSEVGMSEFVCRRAEHTKTGARIAVDRWFASSQEGSRSGSTGRGGCSVRGARTADAP